MKNVTKAALSIKALLKILRNRVFFFVELTRTSSIQSEKIYKEKNKTPQVG